ncbi:MAG: hypothetical protein F4X80_04315 [Chloroflexi bacterium]|nr:hypothetical protein [Chloroflexota bacterium]
MDGVGVLDVPEQLAAPRAGDVPPVGPVAGQDMPDAPPPARRAHRRPVAAGEQRLPPAGERPAGAAVHGDALREPQPLGDGEDAPHPWTGDAHKPPEAPLPDQRPVGHEIEGALLGWPQQRG